MNSSGFGVALLVALPFALPVTLGSCGSYDPIDRARQTMSKTVDADSMGTMPLRVTLLPMREPKALKESSAAVVSGVSPGIVFTINDSGNDPELFAMDTAGNFRGRWRVDNAKNRDWESLSAGACIPDVHTPSSQPDTVQSTCLFVGDLGDNSARRETVRLYQIAEPQGMDTTGAASLASQRVMLRYPDHPRDVEAMYVAPDGTIFLITKRPAKNDAGTLRRALIFAIPAAAWASTDTATAQLIDSLPIVPGSSRLRSITDATLSADARWLAVRTYGQVYTFATDSSTGRILHAVPPAICNIERVEKEHGEGISWLPGTSDLLLTNEGRNAPMHRISCPLPTR